MTNRRNFFKKSGILTLGGLVLNPFELLQASENETSTTFKNKKAKNIIFLVSDGMSQGTLSMANQLAYRKTGKLSNWMQLYTENKVTRALMETASANSLVTDSAAGGSSWGGGFRVNNGSLNVSPTGKFHLPIWQKFKKAGKKAGCVTTVPITHATPASFCVNQESRNSQDDIAIEYANLRFDVMMGGGSKYFDADRRSDKQDMYSLFKQKGFDVVKTKNELMALQTTKPILGVFSKDGLPYAVDHQNTNSLKEEIPTLAEMTLKSIEAMQSHPKGFVLQVEAGKVDWAAHGNDISGLLYDQLAFDEAVKVAIDFAEKDKETLVIITTDHGNANPGLIYGDEVNSNFDSLFEYKHSNDWMLQKINTETSISLCQEIFLQANNLKLSDKEASKILSYYQEASKENGIYNYQNLPFKLLSEIQEKHTSVGWISMKHSADNVELAMFGPGSHLLKPFVKNTDLHYLMLEAAEVENKF